MFWLISRFRATEAFEGRFENCGCSEVRGWVRSNSCSLYLSSSWSKNRSCVRGRLHTSSQCRMQEQPKSGMRGRWGRLEEGMSVYCRLGKEVRSKARSSTDLRLVLRKGRKRMRSTCHALRVSEDLALGRHGPISPYLPRLGPSRKQNGVDAGIGSGVSCCSWELPVKKDETTPCRSKSRSVSGSSQASRNILFRGPRGSEQVVGCHSLVHAFV